MSLTRIVACFALLAVLYYGVVVWAEAQTHYRSDEMEWLPQAKAILRRGAPILEEGDWRFAVSQDSHVRQSGGRTYGLWHPPLYLLALAGHVAIFGPSTESVRLFGALCFIAALVLTGRLTRSLARRAGMDQEHAALCGWLAVGLLALNPYAVQGSIYVDIDNTLLVPLQLLFFVVFFRWDERASAPLALAVVLAITLMFWTKITTPVILIMLAGGYLFFNGRRRAAFIFAALIVTGVSLFVATWWLYARSVGVPFWYPFIFTHARKVKTLFSASFFERLNALRYAITWISFPLCLLWLLTMAWRVQETWHTRRLLPVDLVLLSSLSILGFYSGLVGASSKYVVPAMPFLALGIAWYIITAEILEGLRGPTGWTALLICVGAALLHALVIPDVLTREFLPGRLPLTSIVTALTDSRLSRYALALLPLVGAVIALHLLTGKRNMLWALSASALAVLAPANIVQNVALVRFGATLSSTTVIGLDQVVAVLNREAKPDSVIVGRKDLLPLLTRGQLIPLDREITWRWNYGKDLGAAKALSLFSGCPRAEFLVETIPSRFWEDPRVREALEGNFEQPVQIGSYRLLRRRPRPCATPSPK